MNNSEYSFPHPVLGLGDDMQGDFMVEMDVSRNPHDKKIKFLITKIEVTNNYVNQLLSTSKAGIILKVYCSSSFNTWTFLNPVKGFEIQEDELANKIEVEPLIIAMEEITNYCDNSFNSEFEGEVFTVGKYDIIGLLGKIQVPIDKYYEKLGLGNIFLFVPEDDHTKPVSFDFNTDKIIIKYPVTADGAHPHNALFKNNPWTAYSIIIIPALTEAFRLINNEEQRADNEDKDWFYVLNQTLPKEQREDDPFICAQMILNHEIPLLKAFNELNNSWAI